MTPVKDKSRTTPATAEEVGGQDGPTDEMRESQDEVTHPTGGDPQQVDEEHEAKKMQRSILENSTG